ncbi:MAG: hypothetical protein PF448_13735 [Bacteroidales bacterium]|jgi:hypothetical protein|nr:hypothetical protein [Bacteroidales bacterium]
MKKIGLLAITILLVTQFQLVAQDNVGIGTTTPHSSALLDLTAADKGLLIPRVTLIAVTDGVNPVNGPETGLLVYNSAGALAEGFYYWDGTEWIMVGAGGAATCVTIDEAYDCGGAGVGRAVTADNGAVEITLPAAGTSNSGLDVYSDKTLTWAIGAENTATGVAVLGDLTGTTNEYNAIQGSSYSNFDTGGTGIGSGGVAGFYEGTGDGVGVYGQVVNTASSGVAGIFGLNSRTNGGFGVNGQGTTGVLGEAVVPTVAGFGVYGTAGQGIGVQGETDDMSFYGVSGLNYAINNTGDGIGVMGDGNTGTWGQTVDGDGYGAFGLNDSPSVVANNIGTGGDGWIGIYGVTNDPGTGYGVYSDGNFAATGTKAFVIDHPTDPENKNLKHFCMESPEVLNLYRGNVMLDANGEAVVELPDYFESINTNFSYNLTPIGAPVNLYIKEKINNGQFIIAGGNANMEVSWTVYAERNDKYVQAYPEAKQVEVDKRQPGKYLRPELYGQGQDKAAFPQHSKQETLELKGENLGKVKESKPYRPEK